jgi:hypothetical protein
MRDGVKERGLWHLVASSGEEATTRTKELIEGGSEANRDPLLSACMAMYQRAIEQGGLYLLQEENLCPLCELDRHVPREPEPWSVEWIRGCLDAEAAYCYQIGLAKPPQKQ